MNTYSPKDVQQAIDQLNLKKKDIIYVSGNLLNFGKIEVKSLDNLPKTFFYTVKKSWKRGNNCISNTFFLSCKLKKNFDPNSTLSNSGAFSNYLIKKENIPPSASICFNICNWSKSKTYL